jgi:hypothetical protein
MRATDTTVLREANAAVRSKISPFNLVDSSLHQASELFALLFRDGCAQVLDFGLVFADEALSSIPVHYVHNVHSGEFPVAFPFWKALP